MITFEQRASTVLFNLIQSHNLRGPFLLPANVCPIAPLVLRKARREFQFVDIDPSTLCMSHSAALDRWASSKEPPAGLLYVRTYGAITPTDDFFAAIKSMSPRALVIDDRCLCTPDFPATPASNVDAVVYSTGYAKQVDIGGGGYGVLQEAVPYNRAVTDFKHHDLACMMDQYRAAASAAQRFEYIESHWLDTTRPISTWAAYRQRVEQEFVEVARLNEEINAIYTAKLPPYIQFAANFQAWRFNIQVANKPDVLTAIQRSGLFASRHYQSVAHVFRDDAAPIAERLHRDVVNLFNDRYFSVEQADRLASLLGRMDLSPPEPRWN